MTLRLLADELHQLRSTQAVAARDVHDITGDVKDHEGRIRALEAWRYALPASLATSVLTSAVALVAVIWPK